MNFAQLFNSSGRLSRGKFWLQIATLYAVLYLASSVLDSFVVGPLQWVSRCIAVVAMVVVVLMSIRRLHDRNYSGWWVLAGLIPVVGVLWLFWQLALCRGVPQDNRWGADPLQVRGDYLVVA